MPAALGPDVSYLLGCFFYQHRLTEATQWHKPVGLLPTKDVAMHDAQPAVADQSSGGLLPPIAGAQGKASTEGSSYWGRTQHTRKYRDDLYMNGATPIHLYPPFDQSPVGNTGSCCV